MCSNKIMRKETTGTRAKKAIRKHYQKILQHEQAVLLDRDPEELHQMRVGMRRLRSVTRGFQPILQMPSPAAEKRIRYFGRQLGQLRDLDVLLENLEKAGHSSLKNSEIDYYLQIKDHLYTDRANKVNLVRNLINSAKYNRFKTSLTEWLKSPQLSPIAKLPLKTVMPDLLFPFVNDLFLHLGWMVGIRLTLGDYHTIKCTTPRKINNLVHQNGIMLHSLRKQVKRVRYQLSFFTDLYSKSFGSYVKDMKALQDNLGLLQDSLVMEAMYLSTLDEHYAHKIPTLYHVLQEQRKQAWLKWETLRNKYLLVETRESFRKELLNYT